MHRFVHKKNKTLPVKVTTMETPVRGSARRKNVKTTMWPVLHLSDWIRAAFEEPYHGFFLTGGHRLHEGVEPIQRMLRDFWRRYVFHDDSTPNDPGSTLPIFLHGDEGRGQVKRPCLVVSFQPCISWIGPDHPNSKKPLSCAKSNF